MNSHSVRSMEHCIACGGIGFYKVGDCPAGSLVVALPKEPQHGAFQRYAHPQCVVRRRGGIEKLLSLPDSELGLIRICDVSERTMKVIVNRGA